MRSAARTVLEALARFPSDRREDRLTELFAHVLHEVPELGRWLISSVGVAPIADACSRIEVFTQGAMAGEGRPDLQIYYRDESGQERCVLSEHKLDAELTEFQRAGYPGWERSGLLLIARDVQKYRGGGAAFDSYLTWLQVADEVDRLGVADAGAKWREIASVPEAPSRLRGLYELQLLLETLELGQGSMQALTEPIIDAYSQINSARSRLAAFLELVSKTHQLRDLGSERTITPYPKDNLKDTVWSAYVSVDWPLLRPIDRDYGSEVAIEPSAQWLTDEVDGAVMYAGFYFAISQGRLPHSLISSPEFNAGLRNIDAAMAPQNQHQAKCVKVLPLNAIAEHSTTLNSQVEFAANRAVEAFDELTAVRLEDAV